jgi:ribonuclease HII
MREAKLISSFPQEIIATDEVGRGPLSGPVVVAAVRLYAESLADYTKLLKILKPKGVTDSKKLNSEERTRILDQLGIQDLPYREPGSIELKGLRLSYVTWEMNHEVIDRENILSASLRGMKEACLSLTQNLNGQTTVLIDGKQKLRWGSEASPWTEIPVIQGDSKCLLIGLASIIAKEKRDRHMLLMHELYPHYGFKNHFGYPTVEHRKAIEVHGPCEIHRKTFKGVKEFLPGYSQLN